MQDAQLWETTISKQRLYDGNIFSLEQWHVTLPDGQTATRDIILHNGAAEIIPIDEEGNMILVRQYRPGVDGILLEGPAGKLNHVGEDPLVCAKRELKEETGYTADHWTFLAAIASAPAYDTERIALYMATGLHMGKDDPDEDEFLEVIKVPLAEMVERCMRGEIADAATVCGILMAARKLGI